MHRYKLEPLKKPNLIDNSGNNQKSKQNQITKVGRIIINVENVQQQQNQKPLPNKNQKQQLEQTNQYQQYKPRRQFKVLYSNQQQQKQIPIQTLKVQQTVQKQQQNPPPLLIDQNINFQQQQTQQSRNIKDNKQNYPIAILLGVPGVGKTFIMHKLFPTVEQIKEFTLYKLEDLQYNFVDTTGFNFEDDIDWREAQIKMYQDLFQQYANQISSLFVVVNFERTDLMKKKLISVYKYFRKFTDLISIIVTDFDLSENNEDKENLIKHFKIFKPNDILFVRRDVRPEELKKQLQNQLKKLRMQSIQFDLKDTIFEQENLEEQNIIRNQLLKRIKN